MFPELSPCCSWLQVKLEKLLRCYRTSLWSMAMFDPDPPAPHNLDPKDTSTFRARQLVSEASLPRLLY